MYILFRCGHTVNLFGNQECQPSRPRIQNNVLRDTTFFENVDNDTYLVVVAVYLQRHNSERNQLALRGENKDEDLQHCICGWCHMVGVELLLVGALGIDSLCCPHKIEEDDTTTTSLLVDGP